MLLNVKLNYIRTHTHLPSLHTFSRYIKKCGNGKYEIYCPTKLFSSGKVLMALEFPSDFFFVLTILSIFIYHRDFYSNSFRYLCPFYSIHVLSMVYMAD